MFSLLVSVIVFFISEISIYFFFRFNFFAKNSYFLVCFKSIHNCSLTYFSISGFKILGGQFWFLSSQCWCLLIIFSHSNWDFPILGHFWLVILIGTLPSVWISLLSMGTDWVLPWCWGGGQAPVTHSLCRRLWTRKMGHYLIIAAQGGHQGPRTWPQCWPLCKDRGTRCIFSLVLGWSGAEVVRSLSARPPPSLWPWVACSPLPSGQCPSCFWAATFSGIQTRMCRHVFLRSPDSRPSVPTLQSHLVFASRVVQGF